MRLSRETVFASTTVLLALFVATCGVDGISSSSLLSIGFDSLVRFATEEVFFALFVVAFRARFVFDELCSGVAGMASFSLVSSLSSESVGNIIH